MAIMDLRSYEVILAQFADNALCDNTRQQLYIHNATVCGDMSMEALSLRNSRKGKAWQPF